MVAACQFSLDGKRRQVNSQNLVVSQKTKWDLSQLPACCC